MVLSVFIATFVYSAAGLFTVGLSSGSRTEEFPRLAISGAILLLFASLGMVVYFADHLVHSIQIDAINRWIERNTRRAIVQLPARHTEETAPRAPAWAKSLTAHKSGYLQTVHPELLLPLASEAGVTICLRPRVGQHVVAGTTLGWVWAPSAEDPAPAAGVFEDAVHADIRIGFERTLEQDVGFGIRQQIDIASQALSAAINDPYTAVQAIDHLTVVCCDLAVRPLGSEILHDPAGGGRVVVPGNTFADYLFFVTGLVGRYGGNEYSVMSALVRLIRSCVEVLPAGSERLVSLDQAAVEMLADVERMMQRPADVASVRAAVDSVRNKITSKRAQADSTGSTGS